jgi:hypothetical protein
MVNVITPKVRRKKLPLIAIALGNPAYDLLLDPL